MNIRTPKNTDTTSSKTIQNPSSEDQISKSSSTFSDNRPEGITQRKIQKKVHNSSEIIAQGKLLKNIINRPVLQAVWNPTNPATADLQHEWDTIVNGKQWFYLPYLDKYYFIVRDSGDLDFDDHENAFELNREDVDAEAAAANPPGSKPDFDTKMRRLIMDQQFDYLNFGFFFSETDHSTLKRFEQKTLLLPENRPNIKLCMDYIIDKNQQKLEEAAGRELGGGELLSAGAIIKLKLAFDGLYNSNNFQPKEKGFGVGQSLYIRDGANYKISPFAQQENKIQDVLNKSIWAALGSEVEGLAKANINSNTNVLAQNNKITVQNFSVYFTKRVISPEQRLAAKTTVEKFLAAIAAMSAGTALRDRIGLEMTADFKAALTAKDRAMANPVHKDTKEISDNLPATISSAKLDNYCTAVKARWANFLTKNIVVVFDTAKFSQVYGKTPTVDGAVPGNLMNTAVRADDGLPATPSALINLDSADNLTTLAHELAHVIGFNPTDCEPGGHFTDSNKYKVAEDLFGPKLLFDAYYFEVLISKFFQ